jgi:N utilization substance protein B
VIRIFDNAMRKKNVGRALALQALYQYDLRGEAFLDDAPGFFATNAKDPANAAIGHELFQGVLDHLDDLDSRLNAVAEHWDLKRMASVDRAILRVGAYELLHTPELPRRIVINEAVRLAKKYGAAQSGAFVNGLLDRIGPPPAGEGGRDA